MEICIGLGSVQTLLNIIIEPDSIGLGLVFGLDLCQGKHSIRPSKCLTDHLNHFRDPTRNDAVQGVNNNMLLCRHGKFPFEPNGIGTNDSTEQ